MSTVSILKEVRNERRRQDAKFPDQLLPLGTGPTVTLGDDDYGHIPLDMHLEEMREVNDSHATKGKATWFSVLLEEALEAGVESDPAKVRAELIQVAAVAVRTIENIDAGIILKGDV